MTIASAAAPAAPRLPFRFLLAAAFAAYAGVVALVWWLIGHSLPDQITLSVVGHALHLQHLRDKILGNASLIAVLLPAALWLECITVGWANSSARALLKPTASMKTDLAYFLLDQAHVMGVVSRIMMLGASVISGIALKDWLASRTGFAIDPLGLPLWLQVAIYFHVYSFFDYWAHRPGHTRWFWPLHRYHHAAEDFCVVNGARIHPAGFVGIFLLNIPMPLLGASPEVMIWVNVITIALGFVIHSPHGLRFRLGRALAGAVALASPAASQAGHDNAHRLLQHDPPVGPAVRRLEPGCHPQCRDRRGHALSPRPVAAAGPVA